MSRQPGPGAESEGPGSVLVLSGKPRRKRMAQRDEGTPFWYWLFVFAGLSVALMVANSGWYSFKSDFAYWIGVTGGSMMLLLFLYPLRKRFRWMESTGAINAWFGLHIVFGVCGPFLIIVHSTLELRSMNALIAFACMCLVAVSGLVGRFLYMHVHRGMSEQLEVIEDLKEEEGDYTQVMQQRFSGVPELRRMLEEFERDALARAPSVLLDIPRLLAMNVASYRVRARAIWTIGKVLRQRGRERHWKSERYRMEFEVATRIVRGYVKAVVRLAQFRAYEKLFAAWVFVHVPLAIILLVTAIWHVVAVHMY